MNKSSNTQQLPLAFEHQPYFGKEDFMVADCNAQAFAYVENWPNWEFFALCLYGPTGCGKSHLANMFSDNVSIATHYPYKIPHIKAVDVKLETALKLFEQHNCLIVEDLHDKLNQEAIFHLYNHYRNQGGFILFTSTTAPARLNIALPDLRSRLNIIPSIEIKEPGDDLLQALIVKLFTDRQVIITPDILNYIVGNMQRSYAFARKLVIEIDNISLARKHAVSIPIVKEALAVLTDNHQCELF